MLHNLINQLIFFKDIVLYIRTWDHRMYGNLHQSLELSVQLIQSSY